MNGWKSRNCLRKNLFPFLDRHQGFDGDCDKDAFALRMFKRWARHGVGTKFRQKYGVVRTQSRDIVHGVRVEEEAKVVESQLKVIAGLMYSSHALPARVVSTILGDEKLNALWLTEVKMMADRIIDMRSKLREALEKSGSTLRWKHVTDQIGMFCYSGLTRTGG